MNIGTLTTTLSVDSAGAITAVTRFEQQMHNTANKVVADVNKIKTAVAGIGGAGAKAITPVVNEKPAVNAIQNIQGTLKTVNSALQRFGYLATTAFTLPITMGGRAVFKLAKDYEFAIQKIVGLTGVAQGAVDMWSKQILEIGPRLGKSPQELADALYFISSSGIKGAEAMDVLKISAKAASSGLGETKTVADLLTSALNAYAGTGLTVAYATDVLVAAVREGKAEASGFATAMGQIIPISSQLGVSFDEVAGGMAAITLTGSSSANAAVYLKGVFNSLLTASTKGEKALNAVGTSYAELRKILGTQGLIPLMQKLRNIQVQYGDELVSDVLPNIRALTGYLSIAGKNFEYNTKLMDRVTNSTGALNQAFAAVSNTIKLRYDKAIASLQTGLITFGKAVAEGIIPLLEQWGKKVSELAKWFDSLTEKQKQNRLQVLAFIAVMGPAFLLFSGFVWILRGSIATIVAVNNAIKWLTATTVISTSVFEYFAISITAAATAAAPFILAIVGLGIAITAISPAIRKMIDNWKEWKKVTSEGQEVLDIAGGIAYKGKEQNTPVMQLTEDIGRNMSVLKKLDQTQLENTKLMIDQRIALERERYIAAEAISRKDIENEKFVLETKQKIADKLMNLEHLKKTEAWSPDDLKTWSDETKYFVQEAQQSIEDYIKNRQKVVDYDRTWSQYDIKFYEGQRKQVEDRINSITNANNNLSKSVKSVNIAIGSSLMNVVEWGKFLKDALKGLDFETTAHKAFKIMGADTKGSLYKGRFAEEQAAIEEYNNSLMSQNTIINELSQNFEDMFKHIGGGFKGMIQAFIDSIKLLLAELAGKAVLLALANIFAPGSNFAVGVWKNLFKFTGGIGFAQGGVVPQGYPRDTYPALLSSGETVLPKKLSGAAMGWNMQFEPVELVIKENSLVGILKKADTRKSLY